MIAIEPFRIEHIEQMQVHPDQRRSVELYATDTYRDALVRGFSYTVRIGGDIVMCFGVLDLYEDRRIGHIWTLVSASAPRHMMALHRLAERFVPLTGRQVLVATSDRPAPCRWMRLLGFKFDHIDPDFAGTGEAHAVYVRAI